MIIKQNRGRQWLDWQRRMVAGMQYAGAGACLLLLIALCFGEMGFPGYLAMRDRARQLEIEIQDLQRMTRTFRTDIDRLEHDPFKIEQLARERLGYVRKGETIYQLIPEPSQESSKAVRP
jgi:cell division protein FtsB